MSGTPVHLRAMKREICQLKPLLKLVMPKVQCFGRGDYTAMAELFRVTTAMFVSIISILERLTSALGFIQLENWSTKVSAATRAYESGGLNCVFQPCLHCRSTQIAKSLAFLGLGLCLGVGVG
jgi:hypothetical protein